MALQRQEMDIRGATVLGPLCSPEELEFFREDLARLTQEDVERYGKDELIRNGLYEHVLDLARLGGPYLEVLGKERLNRFIDDVLNDKAVVWSYNAIINKADDRSHMVGFKFHRDQMFFKDTRTSVIVMIPVVDFSPENGSTEYVPGTHLFREMPGADFMEHHKVAVRARAGEAYAVDAALWHRAGVNTSNGMRPMLTIKYVIGPFKQQVDFCASAAEHLENVSPRVRQRLGWNVRVNRDQRDLRRPPEEKRFKSGQYDMTNTSVHDYEAWRADDARVEGDPSR